MIATKSIHAYWIAGGPLLVPLALICFFILYFLVRTHLHASALRKQGRALQRLLAGRTDRLDAVALKGGLPGSAFCSVFRQALAELVQSKASVPLDTMAAWEENALCCLRRDLMVLGALTASAPLVGLLGTVGGMIATFDAVASVSGQTGTRVAGGISQALITTQFGLVIAMPGVFGLAHLRQIVRDIQFLLSDCRVLVAAILGDFQTRGVLS